MMWPGAFALSVDHHCLCCGMRNRWTFAIEYLPSLGASPLKNFGQKQSPHLTKECENMLVFGPLLQQGRDYDLGSLRQMCTGQSLNQKEARTVDHPPGGGSFANGQQQPQLELQGLVSMSVATIFSPDHYVGLYS